MGKSDQVETRKMLLVVLPIAGILVIGGVTLAIVLGMNRGSNPTKQEQPSEVVDLDEPDAAVEIVAAAVVPEPEVETSGLDESAIAFVEDEWFQSQNSGDIAWYTSLLTDEFVAVSMLPGRPKKYEYNREDWIVRREKTIKGAAKTEISDLKSVVDGQTATVGFSYLWNPDDYCDQGRKSLTLSRVGDGWMIAREETVSAQECPLQSHASFRTFIGILAHMLRNNQWAYVRDHCSFPVKVDDGEVADINALKGVARIRELRFASTKSADWTKVAAGIEYVYNHAYETDRVSTVTVKVTSPESGESHESIFEFGFVEDVWALVSVGEVLPDDGADL